jgi:hypothetical protein
LKGRDLRRLFGGVLAGFGALFACLAADESAVLFAALSTLSWIAVVYLAARR